MEKFGQRLRWARQKAGLSQAQLIERLRDMGHPSAQGHISMLENNARSPRAATVDHLAKACNVSPEYLLARAEYAPIDDALVSEINDIVKSVKSLAMRLAIVGERAKQREVGA